jgi:hypothetical protein
MYEVAIEDLFSMLVFYGPPRNFRNYIIYLDYSKRYHLSKCHGDSVKCSSNALNHLPNYVDSLHNYSVHYYFVRIYRYRLPGIFGTGDD